MTLGNLLMQLRHEDKYCLVEGWVLRGQLIEKASDLLKDLPLFLDCEVKDWYEDDADYYDVYILI